MEDNSSGTYFMYRNYIAFRADHGHQWKVSGVVIEPCGDFTLRYAATFTHRWQVVEYIEAQYA